MQIGGRVERVWQPFGHCCGYELRWLPASAAQPAIYGPPPLMLPRRGWIITVSPIVPGDGSPDVNPDR